MTADSRQLAASLHAGFWRVNCVQGQPLFCFDADLAIDRVLRQGETLQIVRVGHVQSFAGSAAGLKL
ncbi:hypothetical protein LP414_30165 [Polaromonas sp. P1(28)-13]|nr:hypothetical protein LP414_30165 [Polaromonas sp. P1(28)-13]